MKQSSLIVLRPVCFFIFLIVVVVSLATLLITIWFNKVARIQEDVKLMAHNINQELIYEIHNAFELLLSPTNATAINLSRILKFYLRNNDPHFSNVVTKVVPALFQASSTIPYLSQVSYIGLNGLLFAYYKETDKNFALYSNSTFLSTSTYTWYLQPVNQDTGKVYGEAIKSPPRSTLVNASWFQEALSSTNGSASVEHSWRNHEDVLFLFTVRVDGNGAVSLGFPTRPLIDSLDEKMASKDGSLYLMARNWNVAIRGLPNTSAVLDGDRVLLQLSHDDGELRTLGNISCRSEFKERVVCIGEKQMKYVINCSKIEISGLQLVYVLVLALDEYSDTVHNMRLSFFLLILMVGAVVITSCIFIAMIVEAARREMFLCNALIKQMESTQQSEQKSMNKSLAFARASHDIRASLAGITGLIEVCRSEASKREPRRSEVEANLSQMEACTGDLLGILNCILDSSKIEAGKMMLEEEEFDMEELLEDVVDLYHVAAVQKGIDVILDPCDGSVARCCWVKGDRSKLKQILSNLLSNAVKFTSEGHVSVGAWARNPSHDNEILGSTPSSWMSYLLSLLFKIHKGESKSEGIDHDPNCMVYMFEVQDTGKGIPKEKRKSVFENYVQVKETAQGEQGTGLGLGIVQSLVRLMGGEIEVVDKDIGERGTCFKFNVVLSTSADSGESCQHSWLLAHNLQSPRGERSRVVLLVKSEQRSKMVAVFMQRLGIKVHVVRQPEHLGPTLEKVRRKLINTLKHSSSGNSSARSAPLSSLDGLDNVSNAGLGCMVLIVIDTRVGLFGELRRAVAEFRRDAKERWCSRVVWLNEATAYSNGIDIAEEELSPLDIMISKSFQGSRLYQTIALLPEFGGIASAEQNPVEIEREEVGKALRGKKVLIVEDDPVGRKIATYVSSDLGAATIGCENGALALDAVCERLRDEGSSFDLILMDCRMPVMDGREATARIREAERGYGIRTLIVALSAHNKGEDEVEKMIEAGVDAYVTKPINKNNLLKVLSSISITKTNYLKYTSNNSFQDQ